MCQQSHVPSTESGKQTNRGQKEQDMSLMAFVCDMGYRDGNSVHLRRKVKFPSQQSDTQVSQRQTVQETNCWRPLQWCRDIFTTWSWHQTLWTRSKADKGHTISGWIHLTKAKRMFLVRDKHHNTAGGGRGWYLLYPTFQNFITWKRQGHPWKETPILKSYRDKQGA